MFVGLLVNNDFIASVVILKAPLPLDGTRILASCVTKDHSQEFERGMKGGLPDMILENSIISDDPNTPCNQNHDLHPQGIPNRHTELFKDGEEPQGPRSPLSTCHLQNRNHLLLSGAQWDSINAQISSSPAAAAREHVEKIRRERYYIGRGEQNPLAEDMHQAVNYLSQELYSKDVHFLMELVQNAEDNEYPGGVAPSLEFLVTSNDITGSGATSTLLIFNNERGFSESNIESICRVGKSTKKGYRDKGYIGEKGIGFKSVFLISSQPHIFSNGYQIKFNENPCAECNIGYIVPEWVESRPSLSDIKQIYGCSKNLPATCIILPLKDEKVTAVKQQLSSLHPEMLLFLSKIRWLSVREDNCNPRGSTVSEIAISSEKNYERRKNMHAESYTLHLSAQEDGNEEECGYYMWRQKFHVNPENRVDKRTEIDEWVITLAFPHGERLSRGKELSPGVYAFLPTEMVTNFPFIIQADFLLASSREAILFDSPWNKGILESIPSAFLNAFIALVKSRADAPAMSLLLEYGCVVCV
ncbi:hypothetical protein ACQ4PT_029435 [Festuca glaucescens]